MVNAEMICETIELLTVKRNAARIRGDFVKAKQMKAAIENLERRFTEISEVA